MKYSTLQEPFNNATMSMRGLVDLCHLLDKGIVLLGVPSLPNVRDEQLDKGCPPPLNSAASNIVTLVKSIL